MTCENYDGAVCMNIQNGNYGKDCNCPEECKEDNPMLTAKEARKLIEKNEERNKRIKEHINQAESEIKGAIKNGKRRTYIYVGYCESGTPQYPEIVEHFKNLGYKLNYEYGTNLYKIEW